MKNLFTPTFFSFLAGFCAIILISFGSLAFLSKHTTASASAPAFSIPTASIKGDRTQIGAWLDKANAYAASGDYAHAEAVWTALSSIIPDDPVPYGNLGRLYYLSLHDYPKAESYFKIELAKSPKQKTAYSDLYDLYSNAYKQDTAAGIDILKQALVAFPNDTDFTILLAEAYAKHGDVAKARASYMAALDLIRASGDVARLKMVATEFSRLP